MGDGFTIEAPASIAGPKEFTTATFGPRLPQRPLSACVVYAEPHDACTPLTNAVAVTGCYVLLDRGAASPGSCDYPNIYFANKVKTAQAAGAVGAIVVNNLDEGWVYMGGVSGDAAVDVTIPSIFVSKATGDVMKDNLHHGLRLSFAAPEGRRPLLAPGIPLHGMVQSNQIRYYEVWTGPGADTTTITLSAEIGQPDLLISSDHTLPNSRFFTWSSRDSGSDTITIAPHDPHACRQCVYYVGVLGADYPSTYTLTASVASTLVTLQGGAPLENQQAPLGEYRYYRFYLDGVGQAVTIALTASTGDADLYASFTSNRPTAGDHTWAAAGRQSCYEVSCGPSISNGDAIHIPANDPGFCAVPPCLLYLGVRNSVGQAAATVAAVFSLLATYSDEEPIGLADGSAVSFTLPNPGTYAYFTYEPSADVTSFEIDVLPSSGDPDLYVSANASRWPDRDDYAWSSTGAEDEALLIRLGQAPESSGRGSSACPGCTYRLAVYAWATGSAFTISVASDASTRQLADGLPTASHADGGGARWYKYPVRTASPIDLVLTPRSGNPSLFASFFCRPLDSLWPRPLSRDERAGCRAHGGPAQQHDWPVGWASAETDGIEAISLLPSDPAFCTPPCMLYVAVRADPLTEGGAATNSSFSLLLTQRVGRAVSLRPGVAQEGVVTGTGLAVYEVELEMDHGFGIDLTVFSGAPSLLWRRCAASTLIAPASCEPPATEAEADGAVDALTPLRLQPSGGRARFALGVRSPSVRRRALFT